MGIILRGVGCYLSLVRANIRDSRGYFVGEIVAINIRDFNISCLIDLGGYRRDLV